MIFNSIRLKNFRQYKKEMTFDFAIPDGSANNITLLVAANGVGKTTLLQAFRYCFYGASSNYLNLPKADELVNNTLVDDLKDFDEDVMFVEVVFTHENIQYLARREKKYIKSKGLLKESNDEQFILSYLTEIDGWKYYKDSEAIEKIKSILPDGLSQIFMFDGERMERNISDPKFSDELKESILGILDIKKYDKLIDVLGTPGKVTSVIGMLNSRKKTNTNQDEKIRINYQKVLTGMEKLRTKIAGYEVDLDNVESKININKEQQEKIKENQERIKKRDQADNDYQFIEDQLNETAEKYIKESKHALVYKLMLINKDKYLSFINKGHKKDQFYDYLHVNTLDSILEKRICVCGRKIEEHSQEEKRIISLKNFSLPIESAQHLNNINQKFKKSVEFQEVMSKLESLKIKMVELKSQKEESKSNSNKLSQEIAQVEKMYGLTNQDIINELMKERDEIRDNIASEKEKLKMYENTQKKLKKQMNKIDSNSEYNQQINIVIEDMNRIKNKLEEIKNEKDLNARTILAKNFDESLNKTIHGNYKVEINHKYQIRIIDADTNKDVTTILSTGQNVVVSLSFINALIQTARELSKTLNKQEKYGVIMDAAMSNLDETHIDRLCRYNLNNMDQLIFLSFKRQLRNEMYTGIKEHIGKAYVLTKNNKGYIEHEEMSLNRLDQYIHSIEEGE